MLGYILIIPFGIVIPIVIIYVISKPAEELKKKQTVTKWKLVYEELDINIITIDVAILLWHLSAMDGNVESAMALGYRHLYSATGGSTLYSDLVDDKMIAAGYHPLNGGTMGSAGSTSHYGVLGTCPTALAYYEAAANGVMDELESGPTKGKVVSFYPYARGGKHLRVIESANIFSRVYNIFHFTHSAPS